MYPTGKVPTNLVLPQTSRGSLVTWSERRRAIGGGADEGCPFIEKGGGVGGGTLAGG